MPASTNKKTLELIENRRVELIELLSRKVLTKKNSYYTKFAPWIPRPRTSRLEAPVKGHEGHKHVELARLKVGAKEKTNELHCKAYCGTRECSKERKKQFKH